MLQVRRNIAMKRLTSRSCDMSWTSKVIGTLVIFCSIHLALSGHSARYSAPLNSLLEDEFKPMVFTHLDSELIARQQFTKTGQYRIFDPVESDLRYNRKEYHYLTESPSEVPKMSSPGSVDRTTLETENKSSDSLDDSLKTEFKALEDLLSSYVEEVLTRKEIRKSGFSIKFNESSENVVNDKSSQESSLKRLVRSAVVNVSLPRAAATGRLFFFSGLKKILWPIFIGIQILKSLLFALFLPSIIGSVGKIVTQGSSASAGFNRPSESVNDLNFKDNFEDDSKFMLMDNAGYGYNQPAGSSNHFSTQLYDAAAANNNALSRFGINDNKDNYLSENEENKKANLNLDSSTLAQIYNSFKKLPPSSLVLSNYDPFYSPLLSRLDSIFDQLGLKTKDENCREKIICFMYADPQKYAPYSNLVSAQLSRELDELRKPTSENPEILRFFRYMKAAKDGQDGNKCEVTYSMCTDFTDFENPAMLNVYNDINKLVEARKFLK